MYRSEQAVGRKGGRSDRGLAPSDKLNILRGHEGLCYKVAFYLLGDEAEAIVAVRKALMELLRDEAFFLEPVTVQSQKAKRAATIQALAVKQGLLRERTGYAG